MESPSAIDSRRNSPTSETPLLRRTGTAWKMCGLVDLFEPLLIVGCGIGATGFVYSMVLGKTAMSVLTGTVFVSSCVAEWRVRVLGVAKELMDSVMDLREENHKLRKEVTTFREENKKFEGLVGLLGDDVQDLQTAKNQLFDLYFKYQAENQRYESNNLLTLFGLIDKNQDSKLDVNEIKRMREYIKIVYKEDFNFDVLDKDNDGCISLTEFFDKFRKERREALGQDRADLSYSDQV